MSDLVSWRLTFPNFAVFMIAHELGPRGLVKLVQTPLSFSSGQQAARTSVRSSLDRLPFPREPLSFGNLSRCHLFRSHLAHLGGIRISAGGCEVQPHVC